MKDFLINFKDEMSLYHSSGDEYFIVDRTIICYVLIPQALEPKI
jgi:hypothetical protein